MGKVLAVEVWGDFACFTRPECKVERMTYPVPTPSAVRGILSAIYSKPGEFYWQIKKIEVLAPIQYLSFKRNEVKRKVSKEAFLVEEERTQRNTVMLKDVRYRIYAEIIKRNDFCGTLEQLYSQAEKRIKQGKCFFQPCLGTRECTAYFEMSDMQKSPIEDTMDFGLMVYDTFDLNHYTPIQNKPLNDAKKKKAPLQKQKPAESYISLYHAVMKKGVIEVPAYDSDAVLKPGGE